ncbi:MAG: ankyrin repeat domain-containing protein [Pseudomonadota bacterium]
MLNIMRGTVFILLLGSLGAACADPVRDLVVAAQLDSAGSVKKLLASGLSPNTIDPISGEPVVQVALREDANQVVDVLVAASDFDPERMAPNGNTALMLAAYKRNKRAVLALLAKGAIVTRPGWTALHYAAASGDTEITAVLLDKHAYIDAESPSKLTPLMIAAREGHQPVVELLLREGADARLRNNEQLTAKQIAERAEKPRIVKAIDAWMASK